MKSLSSIVISCAILPRLISAEPYIAGHYEVLDTPITPSSLDAEGKGCFTQSSGAAIFITPHFSHFELQPSCSLTIVDGNSGGKETYREHGRKNLDAFWAFEVEGDTFCIEYTCARRSHLRKSTFVIDRLGVGDGGSSRRTQEVMQDAEETSPAASLRGAKHEEQGRDLILCGSEDFDSAAAYRTSSNTDQRLMYDAAKAVVKVNMDGIGVCTGFLVGQTQILTARHCFIKDGVFRPDIIRDGTTVYFMYESGLAAYFFSSKDYLGDGGSSADWVMFDVDPNSSGQVPGDLFVPLDVAHSTRAVSGSQIWIPQHPGGRPKEIVSTDTFHSDNKCKFGAVYSNQVRYTCDTEGGTSGSPVLDFSNNKWRVVGIHNFGGYCTSGDTTRGNGGIPIQYFQSDVLALLPSSGTTTAPATTTTTTTTTTTSTTTTGGGGGSCSDDASWRSSNSRSNGPGGRTCSWVGSRDKCGDMFDSSGVSAYDACGCACGTGTPVVPTTTTTVVNTDPTTTTDAPDTCVNTPGWRSTNGKTCGWIGSKPAVRCGRYSSSTGVRDIDACCACQ